MPDDLTFSQTLLKRLWSEGKSTRRWSTTQNIETYFYVFIHPRNDHVTRLHLMRAC